MKKNQTSIVALLTLTLLCFGFNFGISTAAQEIKSKATPTPTPKQSPTVKPTVTLIISPTPILTPTPTPPEYKTLSEVQAKIQTVLARPELQRGQVGIKIVSLETGKIVFEQNAEKYFMPASNMKSYTMAAALEKLSPDFKFVTSVYANALPDANGVVKGDLTIYGRGDVSFSPDFNDGDVYKELDALADKIAAAGIKRIEGNLVGDESYFTGNAIPAGWEWDDLQWKSGAEVSALPVNDNLVELNIKPGSINAPCFVQMLPANSIMKIINRCVTSDASAKREIGVNKKLDQNILEIVGTMPLTDKGYKGNITVSRPAQLFVEMLRGRLLQKGITITGQNKVINPAEKVIEKIVSTTPRIEIAKIESPPLSVIAAKTLKPSQNTYTETVLWTLGEEFGRKQEAITATDEDSIKNLQKTSSADIGVKTVQKFLNEIGIPADSVIQWDGSGLSRHNLITPASAVALYTFMSKSRYANVWRDALTIGAVDGTLRNRFKDTVAADNVRGKTGTIDQVSALSGYVTTASGERFVFSILVNGVNNSRQREAAIDEMVVSLARFNGKTN